jgi:UDP-glucose 4-epimerase
MTTLITGVGAVGSQVAAKLQDMGEDLVIYDLNPNREFMQTIFSVSDTHLVVGDVNDVEFLAKTLRSLNVQRVVHMAGYLSKTLSARPYEGVRLNILGTGSVLEAARNAGVERVVFASTRAVNQIAKPLEPGMLLDEDFEINVLTNRPKTMYELSKLTGEYLGLLYNDLYGIEFIGLRLAGGFGPTPGVPSGLTGTVLRPLLYGCALDGTVVIDDPSLTYVGGHEFIYFKDDAEAIALACSGKNLKKRIYNIRMGTTFTYDQLIQTLETIFPGSRIDVKSRSDASLSPGHAAHDDFADTSAARVELGWEPRYDLASGLLDWAEWVRANERTGPGGSTGRRVP